MKNILSIFIIFTIITIYPALSQWYKGNLHTHTTNSDGDATPRQVVRWYQDHGYHFLVITDHDTLTDIRYLDTDKSDDFILIPGEEVTDRAENKPVHVNAIGIDYQVKPRRKETKAETINADVELIRTAGGVPQINHPNWRYSFNDTVLLQVKNAKLLEIYNIHVENNNYSAGGFLGTEAIWDKALSQGILFYGVVSDDAHDYVGEVTPEKSPPGTGWIMVRAKELTAQAIMTSLENGDFYGTVGVLLKNLSITDREYTVEIEPTGDAKYTTLFIGGDGKILKEEYSLKATYKFKGDEKYVRAKVISSSGDFAITQPVFVK